jgi:hypothetical protein
MQIHDELCLQDLADVIYRNEASVEKKANRHSNTSAPHDVPSLETVQSALYSSVRFAESFLRATGVAGAQLSRMICTPDARGWTLAFGEHFFLVEVVDDGFSVQSFRQSVTSLASRKL